MQPRIKKIQRFSSPLTRRQLGAVLTCAPFGSLLSAAEERESAPWSVVIVPDPQFLSVTSISCSLYDQLIQWAIDNKSKLVNGIPLNIKGFIQVGDCQNDAAVAKAGAPELVAVKAWQKATSANLFVAWCCGNHDYQAISAQDGRSTIGHAWRADTNGAWSPSNLAQKYGSGMDLGNGDFAVWGGVYNDPEYPVSSANNYIRIRVGLRKILIISLEFYPRTSVLNWAKELHDTWSDHEVWLTTHGYMDTLGNQCGRGGWGPAIYNLPVAPASNSGKEMWEGSGAAWSGLTRWPRLALVTCGHWIDGYEAGWVWRHRHDRGIAGQQTLQVFCNAQTADRVNACSTNVSNTTLDVAHLMLLRVWPTSCETFMISTNTGLWTGGPGVRNSNTPIQLFSVPFVPPTSISQAALRGISNSATGEPTVSIGSWVSIYGNDLAASKREWQTLDFIGRDLPTSLDKVSVKFNGRSAAISYISPGQLNVQAPGGLSSGPVTVEVTTPYGSATGTVNLQTYAPGFFTFDQKYAAAVHTDGVYVAPERYFASTASRPAVPGEILLVYGTGFGPTTPEIPAGQMVMTAAPLAPSSKLLFYIGGVTADVQFAGLVAPGLYQFNLVVPAVSNGDQPIIADINGYRTQSGVSISVAGRR